MYAGTEPALVLVRTLVMLRFRRLVPALVASVLLSTALASWTSAPSWSGEVSTGAGTVEAKNLIVGVVVDQFGKPVDDVKVVAVNKKGVVKATELTYASPDNEHPHGYFALHVPRGVYTLELSKKGYESTSKEAGWVARGRTRAMGKVTIFTKRPKTVTKAKLKDDTITTGEHGKVKVTVSSTASKKPIGKVQVTAGDKVVGKGTLAKAAKGVVTVKLDKLKKGKLALKAVYAGSKTLKPSTSKKMVLKVSKK